MNRSQITAALIIALLLGAGCRNTSLEASSTYRFQIDSEGQKRWYYLYLPKGYDPGTIYPLVLVFHGGGGNPDHIINASQFNPIADQYSFLVAYPAGSGQLMNHFLAWNAGGCCGTPARDGTDDVAYSQAVLDDIKSRFKIDPDRVYASGHSNGALMVYRLACDLSESFAAIAPVAGTLPVTPCRPSESVSILHIHGLNDANLPYEGSQNQQDPAGILLPSVHETVLFWADRQHCETPPVISANSKVSIESYLNCDQGTQVALYTLIHGGHAWPAIIDGPDSTPGLTTAELIWHFFDSHPKP